MVVSVTLQVFVTCCRVVVLRSLSRFGWLLNEKAARVEVNISLVSWLGLLTHKTHPRYDL